MPATLQSQTAQIENLRKAEVQHGVVPGNPGGVPPNHMVAQQHANLEKIYTGTVKFQNAQYSITVTPTPPNIPADRNVYRMNDMQSDATLKIMKKAVKPSETNLTVKVTFDRPITMPANYQKTEELFREVYFVIPIGMPGKTKYDFPFFFTHSLFFQDCHYDDSRKKRHHVERFHS